jgi:hypothetical protein
MDSRSYGQSSPQTVEDEFKGGQIGPALIDRHRHGCPMVSYRSFEVTPRCKRIAPGAKQEINCVPVLVQRAIQITSMTS